LPPNPDTGRPTMDAHPTALRALAALDLTSLNDLDDEAAVAKLCARAQTPHGPVAAVCVWPRFAAQAKAALAGTSVKVACVANFPSGSEARADVLDLVRRTLAAGADEIDLVFPYREWQRGEKVKAETMVASVKEVCGAHKLKLILETGAFADMGRLALACKLALEAGADMLKTSTGKIPVGATPEAARVLLEAGGGFKVSGGVRTLDDAALYLDLADEIRGPGWATSENFRIGASGLLDVLLATLDGTTAVAARQGY
jgi:deoxyribose-phosphate aldolase